jgi:hypothetical protein
MAKPIHAKRGSSLFEAANYFIQYAYVTKKRDGIVVLSDRIDRKLSYRGITFESVMEAISQVDEILVEQNRKSSESHAFVTSPAIEKLVKKTIKNGETFCHLSLSLQHVDKIRAALQISCQKSTSKRELYLIPQVSAFDTSTLSLLVKTDSPTLQT